MAKYIDAEKLYAKVDALMAHYAKAEEEMEDDVELSIFYQGKRKMCSEVINLIDSLQQEQPEVDLEEAARHSEILTYPMPEDGDIDKVMKVQEARIFHEIGFKAGAEWMASQMPLPEDTVIFQKGVEEGKRLMMENALDGVAHPDDCEIWVNLVGYGYDFKDGDKVRIAIVKEEEK